MQLRIILIYKFLSILIISAFLCASCTSQKPGYYPKRYRKGDCNCSSWTLNIQNPEAKTKSAS